MENIRDHVVLVLFILQTEKPRPTFIKPLDHGQIFVGFLGPKPRSFYAPP